MRKPVYIDTTIRVFEGDEAAARLAENNDRRFYEEGRGVVRVDEARWAEAQKYERATWMERLRSVLEDRNRRHLSRFFQYEALAGQRFNRAIELGCGPFTNLRLILEVAAAEHVHLLDPLIREYVTHPTCRFRSGRFGGVGSWLARASLSAIRHPRLGVAEALNAIHIGGLRGRPVNLEASAIEDFETPHRYDLIVMVNVIEHCRDVDAVLAKINDIIAPGGMLVFHDRFMTPEDLRATVEDVFDAGHPIRVEREVIDAFLKRNFRTVFSSEFLDVEECGGREFPSTSLYYIGRRLEKVHPTR